MKKLKHGVIAAIALPALFICFSGCSKDDRPNITGTTLTYTNKMKITVGSTVFNATLNDNATVTAFKAMLPLTINMSELGGVEKFYYFPSGTTLPVNASNPGTIQNGDLMLYGNNCLVLFYTTFNTSYTYTRLGRVDNPAGLAAALGSGSVTITFEME